MQDILYVLSNIFYFTLRHTVVGTFNYNRYYLTIIYLFQWIIVCRWLNFHIKIEIKYFSYWIFDEAAVSQKLRDFKSMFAPCHKKNFASRICMCFKFADRIMLSRAAGSHFLNYIIKLKCFSRATWIRVEQTKFMVCTKTIAHWSTS